MELSKPTQIVPASDQPEPGVLAMRPDLAEAARDYAEKSEAPATKRATAADWRVFSAWCSAHGVSALPATAETVAAYLVDKARGGAEPARTLATILRARATIGKLHRLAGHDPPPTAHPMVIKVLAGIRRDKGIKPPNEKRPLTAPEVKRALGAVRAAVRLGELRDRAIALLGVTTSLRRSEIVAIDVEHLKWRPDGIVVDLKRSKTDQLGVGRDVPVPRLGDEQADVCPVRALSAWLAAAKIESGAVFRPVTKAGTLRGTRLAAEHVAAVVKRCARALELDVRRYAGHSLRSGFVTTMRAQGRTWGEIMSVTGHRRTETVRRYDRGVHDPFKESQVHAAFRAAFTSTGNERGPSTT